MKIPGKTVNKDGELIEVYECSFCGSRSVDKERINKCEKECYLKEQHFAGLL